MSKMHWEGNVRELRSFVRRIFLASKDEEISCKTIIDFLKNQSNIQSNIIKEASQEEILNFILSFKDEILDKGAEVFIENLKQKMYKYFLEECQGNKAETARILKIEKSTFRKALERLGM